MRRAGLALVVVLLVGAAWLLGRHGPRATEAPQQDAGTPPALVAPDARPKIGLISRRDGEVLAGVRVMGDEGELGTTDSEGRLVVPDSTDVRVAGYVPDRVVVNGGRTEWVELSPGIAVSGIVRDGATREPVAGASVTRSDVGGDTWEERVETDAGGRFEMLAPLGQAFDLGVSGRDFADVVERHIAEAPIRDLQILVGRGGILEGIVTRPDGAPPGMPVGLLVLPACAAEGRGDPGRTLVYSDAQGRFRLRGLPLGVDFSVVTFGNENGRSEPVRFEREDELHRRNLRIPAQGSLAVKIEVPGASAPGGDEAEEGDPLALACVEVETDDDRPGAPTLVGGRAWGAETSFDLPPGPFRVTVTIGGWPAQERRVIVQEGETSEETFRFEGGETVEGLLLDTDGTPAGSFAVWCRGRGFVAESETDANGRFLFRGLPNASATLVTGYWEDAVVVWRGPTPAKDLVVRRPRAALLTGRVVSAPASGVLRIDARSEGVWWGEDDLPFEGGRFSARSRPSTSR